MIRTKRNAQTKQISGINITPFTDVCLVLLIIFMVTASALTQKDSGFIVPLPKASPTVSLPTAPLIAYLKADSTMYLNDQPVTFETLGASILAVQQDSTEARMLVVKADKEVPYQQVITTIDIARNAGVNQIGLATQPPDVAPER